MDKIKINMIEKDYLGDTEVNTFTDYCMCALEYLLSEDRLPDVFWEVDLDAEEKFNLFFNSDFEQQLVFLGDEGTGKTHFLKTYFSLSSDENFCIKDNQLLIFFSGDGNGILENNNIVNYFADEIRKVCEYYEKRYNGSEEIVTKEIVGFYQFILDTKKDVLPRVWLTEKLDESVCEKEIRELKNTKPFTYYLMRLKYDLISLKTISNVIVIFDNINNEEMFEPIVCKMDKCIRNYNRDKYSGYCVKTVFVMNSTVFWKICDKKRVFTDKIVKKNKNFNMQGLFDDRFEKSRVKGEKWMIERGFDLQNLEYAKQVLTRLNSRFSHKYQKMILGLSMYNKELILKYYKKVVFNKTWVRKKRFSYASDAYDENKDFLFNNITCVRALACGDDQVYNPANNLENPIPNILYNTEEEEYGIYILLLMKYFLRQKGVYLYREDSGEDLLKVCRNIWGEGIEYNNFKTAIDYLLHKNILAGYFQEFGKDFKSDCSYKLYITEKGAELWDLIRSDSIVMELCREDCYRPVDSQMESSYVLINTERQYLIFEDLIKMTGQIREDEDSLYRTVKEKGCDAEYVGAFGKKRMAFYLLEGISKSITYSISRSNEELKKMLNEELEAVCATR